MSETLKIIIAGVIVFVVGLPIVIIYDKWKKEERDD
jgi:hypothetical protein